MTLEDEFKKLGRELLAIEDALKKALAACDAAKKIAEDEDEQKSILGITMMMGRIEALSILVNAYITSYAESIKETLLKEQKEKVAKA